MSMLACKLLPPKHTTESTMQLLLLTIPPAVRCGELT
jgi:hypothetical protein